MNKSIFIKVFLIGKTYNLRKELNVMLKEVEDARDLSTKDILMRFFKSWERKPMMLCIVLFFFQQFTGITGILLNLQIVFEVC